MSTGPHTNLFTRVDRTEDPDFFVRFMDEAQKPAAIQASKANGYLGTVSYVRLAELSASYTLPARFARRFRSQSATFTVAGRNLGLWSNYRGADPTTSNASYAGVGDSSTDDGTGLAQPRNWVVRLNFQF